ncbi:MAG: hypothetical protein M3464_05670 [Chloroflexota bacterium]|nr:hypothetical protein [Chloroflexota bacterium]
MLKQRIATAALAATLFGSATVGTISAQSNRGGAAGLIAAVVQVAIDDGVVTVNVVDSFNNLRALNNVLSNNDVDITVGDVTVLQDFLNDNTITLQDFLNDNNIVVLAEDVVAIGILSTDDIIIFV